MGRDDEAAMHLAAAIKMDRRAEYAYILEAEIFLADGKPQRVERARAALDSAIAASPNPARRSTDRLYKALALFYDGRATEGMAEAAAVAKDDEAAGALAAAATKYSQLAELAGGIGDSADVDKWLGEAHRVSPSANVGIQSVQALALGHQPAAARRALDDGMRGTDTTTANAQADLHRLRGMILLADGKPAEALAEMKKGDPRQNTFSELAMIDAYTALKDQKNADATRAALLARPGISGVSLALASYRAQKKK
jgi:hypothetical protein